MLGRVDRCLDDVRHAHLRRQQLLARLYRCWGWESGVWAGDGGPLTRRRVEEYEKEYRAAWMDDWRNLEWWEQHERQCLAAQNKALGAALLCGVRAGCLDKMRSHLKHSLHGHLREKHAGQRKIWDWCNPGDLEAPACCATPEEILAEHNKIKPKLTELRKKAASKWKARVGEARHKETAKAHELLVARGCRGWSLPASRAARTSTALVGLLTEDNLQLLNRVEDLEQQVRQRARGRHVELPPAGERNRKRGWGEEVATSSSRAKRAAY